jgi:hypothetical protein
VQSPVAYPWSGRQAKSAQKKRKKAYLAYFGIHYKAFGILYLYNIR